VLAIALLWPANSVWAVIIPPGPHTFDSNLTGNAFVDFQGGAFTTPLIAPVSTFGVTVDGNPLLHQDYPLSSFHIDSGFVVTSSFVFDTGPVGVSVGDAVFSSISGGAFHISDNVGIILSGTFTSATFTTAVGATAGSLSSSNINNLLLTPGPRFTFDNTSVSAINAPTGFSISLSAIPFGVSVGAPGPPGLFIPVTLLPFALSTGSTVVSGAITVVPEPSAFCLAGLAGVMLAARSWRRRRSG